MRSAVPLWRGPCICDATAILNECTRGAAVHVETLVRDGDLHLPEDGWHARAHRATHAPASHSTRSSKSLFANFDAAKARCFLDEDRQQLLAVIKAGFGNFKMFNTRVRAMFAQRLGARGDAEVSSTPDTQEA